MRSVIDLKNIKGKRVFVRVDFNVPIIDGKVHDDFRIASAFRTINFLRAAGAKTILASHFEGKGGDSLRPVFEYLKTFFPLSFETDYLSSISFIDAIPEGGVVLLENLRLHAGEKANDPQFAKSLASLGNYYVNEAFSSSHRAHASIVGVPRYISGYAGIRFTEEVKKLGEMLNPAKPFLFILGGAKFDTKLPLIEKFFSLADHVFVAGALAHNFFKEKNYPVGGSLVTEGNFNLGRFLDNSKLILPHEVLVSRQREIVSVLSSEVKEGDRIVDAGEKTVEDLREIISSSKTILWNGPLGAYEEGFTKATEHLAKVIAESNAYSVVGGGDTIAAISSLGLNDRFGFISTGGGAMLDFLANGTLPGIEALS
ncbi:MAG: phosphoglycerate kinase [Patescibacteria group bacterium]